VKLEEIREKYLTLHITSKTAEKELNDWMSGVTAAHELLALWCSDEWERSKRAKATDAQPPGRQYPAMAIEDIHDEFMAYNIGTTDADRMLRQLGLDPGRRQYLIAAWIEDDLSMSQ